MSAGILRFVTGQLAAPALRKAVAECGLDRPHEVTVLPAQVAALMTPGYIARRLPPNLGGELMIPGRCAGELGELRAHTGAKVIRGPKELDDLPAHFGFARAPRPYGAPKLQILAEIVDAPLLSIPQLVRRANHYRAQGADWIDLGCRNDTPFPHLAGAVRALRRRGINVSVDTFNPAELRAASRAGARMFLSVNSANLEAARALKGTVVVIPDFGKGLPSLYRNAERLARWNVDFILDPILDPLPLGAARSIARYVEVRRRFPEARMLMGVGNLVELTAADNVGINALLAGFMAEMGINYALTTEVAPWNRGAVRQLSIARHIMERAVDEGTPPKGYDRRLLVLRDAKGAPFSAAQVAAMRRKVRDPNFRIFVAGGMIHVFNSRVYVKTKSADGVFAKLDVADPSHAYYLGRELERAENALRLGKRYTQENPLDWGYLDGGGE